MRIYLDDDLDSNLLIEMLRLVGHEVFSPRSAGTRGAADEDHLRHAVDHGLVLLSANAHDYVDLHDAWTNMLDEHHGILIVYRENNPTRDMMFRQIADAVTNLERSGATLANTYHNLNFWKSPPE